jgi:hypothetical protein
MSSLDGTLKPQAGQTKTDKRAILYCCEGQGRQFLPAVEGAINPRVPLYE